MLRMDKFTTGVSYGASGGSAAFWIKQLLDGYPPKQWAAIGVLGIAPFNSHPRADATNAMDR